MPPQKGQILDDLVYKSLGFGAHETSPVLSKHKTKGFIPSHPLPFPATH